MMKRKSFEVFLACLLILIMPATVLSQSEYGNEWINNNQEYYKIPIIQEGIYKISYQDLIEAGLPVNQIDPRKLQLYSRGQEVSINVSGQLDARIDPVDFIEFYAKPNDGYLDQELYSDPEAQPHSLINLFSDTAYYFLTWVRDASFGKRMSAFFQNNVADVPAQTHYFKNETMILSSDYSAGTNYPEGTEGSIWLSSYDRGEGWTGTRIRKGSFQDIWVDSLDAYFLNGSPPELELLLTGRNGRSHKTEIFVGSNASSLRLLTTAEFDFYKNHKIDQPLQWSDFGPEGKILVRVQSTGFDDNLPDFVSVAYLQITLPLHPGYNGGNLKFTTPAVNNTALYFDFPATEVKRILELNEKNEPGIIGFNQISNKINFMVPSEPGQKVLFVTDTFYVVDGIRKVNLKRTSATGSNYLIVSHSSLRVAAGNYEDPIKAYADYRQSAAGGGYQVKIFDINDLYNEFSYGEITPLAIRRLAKFMKEQGQAEYLLLIGKGMDVNLDYYRKSPSDFWYPNLIPSFGFPGSDIAFTANLSGNGAEPLLFTGRISASWPGQVAAYLDKIKEMEANSFDQLWRKELVHLSGGFTAAEHLIFQSYIKGFKALAENKFLGGNCLNISKKTNNSVELINISDEINQGKMMITFFGHSGSNNSDIDIGYISSAEMGYHNKGKYPLLLINGCNAGGIFNNTKTFGEDWLVTPDKGSIGVVAHSAFGYSRSLKRYSDEFYLTGLGDSSFIHQPIGKVHQEVAKRFIEKYSETPENVAQVQQMVYQGDPAFRLFGTQFPDYEINEKSVFVKTEDRQHLTAFSDSIRIHLIVKNFGVVGPDSISLVVERIREDGVSSSFGPYIYPSTFYLDTLSFQIPLGSRSDFGNNEFIIKIDALDSIQESNESNNQVKFNYFIPLRGVSNLYPQPFSIINENTVELIAQSTDLLDQERLFKFELDTIAAFSSGYKKQFQVSGKVLVRQPLNLINSQDTIVYYWRSKFADPAEGEDGSWFVSSFTYIPQATQGWIQTVDGQFDMNQKVGLKLELNQWKYEETNTEINIVTFGPDHDELDYTNVEVYINGLTYVFSGRLCSNNSLNLIAFDQSSTVPYLGLNFGGWDLYDRRSCGRRPQVINSFLNIDIENSDRDYLTKFIDNIADGDFVVMFTAGEVTFESWPEHLWEKMAEIGGGPSLKNLKNGQPMIAIGRKNLNPGDLTFVTAEEGDTPLRAQRIKLDHVIHGRYSTGYLITDKIGPANNWESLTFKTWAEPDDQVDLDIFKIALDGKSEPLFENINQQLVDLTHLNAQNYPYLQLKYSVTDKQNSTPGSLNLWQVLYEQVPEGILVSETSQESIVIQEGENKSVRFKFENISNVSFKDSIVVEANFYNQESHQTKALTSSIKPLAAGESEVFEIDLPSKGLAGTNDFQLFVNPRILPEQSYGNNMIYFKDFYQVQEDHINPVVDVTFDGQHILDGDIISPSPLIEVLMKDENKFLHKEDTAGIQLLIKQNCDGCSFKKINFNDQGINWKSASNDKDFTITYQPEPLENGTYTLQVQGSDASGNLAGIEPYQVNFEVVNESAITNFYPYPNPFSSSTRFVFTLTGTQIPEDIKIQIMTISGKIVREIIGDELGPIKIGHNISTYAWDGKDEFGDQLANGVYFYKVEVESGGELLDKRASGGDRGFKDNIGKLYLLR